MSRLDEYIVGQGDAKRAIAVALRNRWRRMRVPDELRGEIMPKNILMIGPTGVGKTEVARRMAKLVRAPFVKVEATKYTEVGFHGRDVDTIVRDLVESSFSLVREVVTEEVRAHVRPSVRNALLRCLTGERSSEGTRSQLLSLLDAGKLEDSKVRISLPPDDAEADGDEHVDVAFGPGGPTVRLNPREIMERLRASGIDAAAIGVGPDRAESVTAKMETMSVREARSALEEAAVDRIVAPLDLRKEAVTLAEQHGIVFVDEIDKIVADKTRYRGGDASDEGVQRDLLPLIEGTTVDVRKFGNVRTDHMLFICSGAFHSSKPSDMLAELQGRLPIRVELKALTEKDLYRILTEPKANMVEQHKALIAAEGVTLDFKDEALREIAHFAAETNRSVENIGARRLHTILERVLEEISFTASEQAAGTVFTVDKALVQTRLAESLQRRNMRKFII